MADILQFRPRPRPASAGAVDVRAEIEEAVQFALDTADRLMAVLNDINGEPGVALELDHREEWAE